MAGQATTGLVAGLAGLHYIHNTVNERGRLALHWEGATLAVAVAVSGWLDALGLAFINMHATTECVCTTGVLSVSYSWLYLFLLTLPQCHWH